MSRSSPPTHLPPLAALRAFEAVGRLGGVRLAAEELYVTPGAVSRQISLLEEHVGVELFHRHGRGLRLTPRGTPYHREVSDALDALLRATAALRGEVQPTLLRIRSYMTFAMRWLIPRLGSFQAVHPGIDVRLTIATEWRELDPGELDAAVRLGGGDWPGFESERLVDNELVPVCGRELAVAPDGLAEPRDLRSRTLLHALARANDWDLWLSAAGLPDAGRFRRRDYETSALAYQAAIDGEGVALAQAALVEEDLRTGRLVAPLDLKVDTGEHTYYLVWPEGSRESRRLAQLADWLRSSKQPPGED